MAFRSTSDSECDSECDTDASAYDSDSVETDAEEPSESEYDDEEDGEEDGEEDDVANTETDDEEDDNSDALTETNSDTDSGSEAGAAAGSGAKSRAKSGTTSGTKSGAKLGKKPGTESGAKSAPAPTPTNAAPKVIVQVCVRDLASEDGPGGSLLFPCSKGKLTSAPSLHDRTTGLFLDAASTTERVEALASSRVDSAVLRKIFCLYVHPQSPACVKLMEFVVSNEVGVQVVDIRHLEFDGETPLPTDCTADIPNIGRDSVDKKARGGEKRRMTEEKRLQRLQDEANALKASLRPEEVDLPAKRIRRPPKLSDYERENAKDIRDYYLEGVPGDELREVKKLLKNDIVGASVLVRDLRDDEEADDAESYSDSE